MRCVSVFSVGCLVCLILAIAGCGNNTSDVKQNGEESAEDKATAVWWKGDSDDITGEDWGIESASKVVIVDPENPQQGMVYNAYNYPNWMGADELKESNSRLQELPALKTGVDKSEKFGKAISHGVHAAAIKWDGFIKCKLNGIYTFVFNKREYCRYDSGYSVRINGVTVLAANYGETSCDVKLKKGWNKVEIVCQFRGEESLNVSYKPKDSLEEPRELTPAMLFYDCRPEPEW